MMTEIDPPYFPAELINVKIRAKLTKFNRPFHQAFYCFAPLLLSLSEARPNWSWQVVQFEEPSS
jgi:hypothetical protein